MKKITSVADLGGAPVNKGDLREVFNDEIWDAIEGLLSPFASDTEGIIVSGCAITGVGPYEISAGIVYLNGEFMRLPAASAQTLPKYIAAATAVNDDRTFADSTVHTLYITKSAELLGAAPGSGQYIAITSTTDPEDRRWNPAQSNTVKIRTKVIEIGDWNMDLDTTKIVAHGITDAVNKIRRVSVIIRGDGGTYLKPLEWFTTEMQGGVNDIDATNIVLARVVAGSFDSVNFDATAFNRGWISIDYEA